MNNRLKKILEIISQHEISTQNELVEHLKNAGFYSTQSTVSRDIKKLNIVKIIENGKYKYFCENNKYESFQLLKKTIKEINYSSNIVIIKCDIGMASAVCTKIDLMNFEGVLGTISGDDSIFVLTSSSDSSKNFINNLKKYL